MPVCRLVLRALAALLLLLLLLRAAAAEQCPSADDKHAYFRRAWALFEGLESGGGGWRTAVHLRVMPTLRAMYPETVDWACGKLQEAHDGAAGAAAAKPDSPLPPSLQCKLRLVAVLDEFLYQLNGRNMFHYSLFMVNH
jgi:hypothetical protein